MITRRAQVILHWKCIAAHLRAILWDLAGIWRAVSETKKTRRRKSGRMITHEITLEPEDKDL